MPQESLTASRYRSPQDSPGHILDLITTGKATTRTAIARLTGLSRSTIGQRLDALFNMGLLRRTDDLVASGGRPARGLCLDTRAGLLGCVDFGEERTRIAVADLDTKVITDCIEHLDLSDGPEILIRKVTQALQSLLRELNIVGPPLMAIALGLPAPVDYRRGCVTGWSIMSGWAEYDIREQLKQTWNVPVLVDNDVNLLTLAEHRRNWTQYDHILYIKVGTGVGSGMVINGAIHRGAQGAAGDIGHAQMNGYGDPQCRCGNFGCLEALVGGWALARDISTICDIKLHDARAVAKEVRHGNSQVVARLRAAGRIVGEAASSATSLVNPDIITLGGTLGTIGDHLLAGVREAVYQRAPALATRQLKIVPTQLRSHAAIIGAAYLARDHILAPEMVDGRIPATD